MRVRQYFRSLVDRLFRQCGETRRGLLYYAIVFQAAHSGADATKLLKRLGIVADASVAEDNVILRDLGLLELPDDAGLFGFSAATWPAMRACARAIADA